MKKLALLLMMIAALAGCGSSAKSQDPNALPDGIMQPVEGTGAVAGGSFMPEIQRNTMPQK